MNSTLHLNFAVQTAGTFSLPLPLLIVAAGVVALLVVALLVGRWRLRARPTRPQVPVEAPELTDLRVAETTEDIRFCVDLARSVGGPVLELGSGTGRIALELAQRGLVVTALEPSRRMVQWAKTKAEQRSAKRQVEWIESELTSFSLGGRTFKLILAPGNVLQRVGAQSALERCLRSVADHLEPDGTFVAIVEPPRWEALSFERRYLKTVHNARTGELITIHHSLEVDPLWQQVRETYTHEIWDQKGHRRDVVVPFEGSYLTCPQMSLLLRAAKMRLEAVYGSFAREPLTVKSRQMIFVARPLPEAIQPVPAPSAALPAELPALVGGAAASAPSETKGRATPGSTRPLRSPSSRIGSKDASGAAGESPAPGAPAQSQMPPDRSSPDALSGQR